MTNILNLQDIRKSYNVGTPVETEVLHGISLSLAQAEFVSLTGPSGSGKSTLLNIVGLLEPPTAGTLEIDGHAAEGIDDVDESGKVGEYGVINGHADELTNGFGGEIFTTPQRRVNVAIDMGGIDAGCAVARNRDD